MRRPLHLGVPGELLLRDIPVAPVAPVVTLGRRKLGVSAKRDDQVRHLLPKHLLHAGQIPAPVRLELDERVLRRVPPRELVARLPVLRARQRRPRVLALDVVDGAAVLARGDDSFVLRRVAVRVPDVRDHGLPRAVPARDVHGHRARRVQAVVKVGVVPAVLLKALVVIVYVFHRVLRGHHAPVDVDLVVVLRGAVVAVPEHVLGAVPRLDGVQLE
mmetsp:Transcript_8156/g.34076  ORF Transcript_8156/g.34076 Transcript_8156/m.34076 type:complete len:216 (+) Transcript_8156:1576-2223(+)